MSIRAFDRAQDAYNLAKKEAVQTKVIVFVCNIPKTGVFPLEIRFPYPGKIVDVYASCGKVGADRTIVLLEKCGKADYMSSPNWSTAAYGIWLEANERTTLTASTPPVVMDDVVDKDDHFRVNFTQVGNGISNVTIEVVVEI